MQSKIIGYRGETFSSGPCTNLNDIYIEDKEPRVITVPIVVGFTTLIGVNTRTFPVKHGNCFSLIDPEGKEHKVVNFAYENLREWMGRTNQRDISVRCIPKSNTLWEIVDDRIPLNWYNREYCTVCTPLRILPVEQRKREVKNCKFKKISFNGRTSVIKTYKLTPSTSKLNFKCEMTMEDGTVCAPFIPKI